MNNSDLRTTSSAAVLFYVTSFRVTSPEYGLRTQVGLGVLLFTMDEDFRPCTIQISLTYQTHTYQFIYGA